MKSPELLEKRLAGIFTSEEIALSSTELPTQITVFPTSIEEITALIKLAIREKYTLLPIGGGTRLFSFHSKQFDIAVSLTKLPGEINHSPADLIATVPAGMPYANIQNQLAFEGQMIPLNPPHNAASTIGGIISANAFGPRRFRYGAARDCILETHLINGNGSLVKSGAKIVKNVSGYDLNKLYIGSLGSLGILTNMTIKLQPVPEQRVTFSIDFNSFDSALQFSSSLRQLQIEIEAIVISNSFRNSGDDVNCTLFAELAGTKNGLTKQLELIKSCFGSSQQLNISILEQSDSLNVWNTINRLRHNTECIAKLSLTKKDIKLFFNPSHTAIFKNFTIKIFPFSDICYIHSSDYNIDLMNQIISLVKSLNGFIEFESLPPDSNIERWPILPSSLSWMRQIKKSLDPNGVFAPGSFIGGI